MARKRHTAEEIVAKLRQVEVLVAQGRPVAEAIRAIEVTEVRYYRWQNEYGPEERPGEAAEGIGNGECPAAPSFPVFACGNNSLEKRASDFARVPGWGASPVRRGMATRMSPAYRNGQNRSGRTNHVAGGCAYSDARTCPTTTRSEILVG